MNNNKVTNRFVISKKGIENKVTNEFVNKKGDKRVLLKVSLLAIVTVLRISVVRYIGVLYSTYPPDYQALIQNGFYLAHRPIFSIISLKTFDFFLYYLGMFQLFHV